MDLAWDGTGPPKLLEYNGDTPSVLVESAKPSLNWCADLQAKHKNARQANFMDPALIQGFKRFAEQWKGNMTDFDLGILCVEEDLESVGTAEYLKKLANREGVKTIVKDISQLELDYNDNYSKILPNFGYHQTFSHVLKMYPYEWIVHEINADPLLAADLEDLDTIEPAWKLIIGNKAILPLLWEMFPNHKNLLPAYFIDPKVQLDRNNHAEGSDTWFNTDDLQIEDWISKPKFGREGHGVLFS